MTDLPRESGPAVRPAGKGLASLVALETGPRVEEALSPAAWAKIAVAGALFALVNFWQIEILWARWRADPNWSHGFIIPLFSLYLLYVRRGEILSAPRKASLSGLPLFLLGLVGSALGVFYFRTNWASHASLVLALLGLVAYVSGWGVVRVAWVPIVYLILAMPLPDALYEKIALPLQSLAAAASAKLLGLFGVQITVDALHLQVVSLSGKSIPLNVEEACSGIRSMMAFVALSVAWAYITDRPWWHRLALVLAGVPVMIACNILRVALTATMFVIDKRQFGEDLMHELMGMVLLIPAAGFLWLLSKLLSSLFVEVEEEEEEGKAPSPGAPGAASAQEGAQA